MSLARGGVLGAALAASLGSAVVALTEAQPEPSDQHVRDVVKRARSSLADRFIPAQDVSGPAVITSAADAARARAVLDRYYQISAEAESANSQKAATADEKPQIVIEPKRFHDRVPAESVFEDFDLSAVSGPICKRFVICGAGTAAWSAIDAILKVDPDAAKDIVVISEEAHFPYNRTVLSKELWEGEKKQLFRSEEATKYAVEYGYKTDPRVKISIVRNKKIVHLDTDEKKVIVSGGAELHYDKILFATGGKPRDGSHVSSALSSDQIRDKVTVFRTLEDFRDLRKTFDESSSGAIVVGGGFLGTELAIALASISDKVSLVVAEPGVLYKVLPRYLCEFLGRKLTDIGINLVRSATISDSSKSEGGKTVSLDVKSPDAGKVTGGHVVVAVGIDPEVGAVKASGLELDAVNGGIQVNDFMMAEPDVFAAGDVASFHDRSLGRRRVEHWDHAVVSGQIAGQNMLGKRARYGFQSMFWSDLSNVGVHFTAVGLVDSSLDTVAIWNMASPAVESAPSANEYTSGVVFYLRDGEIVGALLWNPDRSAGSLRRARAVISARLRADNLSDDTLAAVINLEPSPFRTSIRTKAS